MDKRDGMKQINVILDEALHRKVKEKAGAMGITVQDGYADALQKWVTDSDPAQSFTLEDLRKLGRFWLAPVDKGDEWLKKSLQYILDQRYS